MKLFGSTSPSYLILLSLEDCNRYLAGPGEKNLPDCFKPYGDAPAAGTAQGVTLLPMEGDYAKLTLDALAMGYTGEEMTRYLDAQGMDWEYADQRFVVLMLSPQNTETELLALENALISLPKKKPADPTGGALFPAPPQRQMELRQGYFAPREEVNLEQAVGRISAVTQSCCPPGVPVVMPGEEITPQVCRLLKQNGTQRVEVVRQPPFPAGSSKSVKETTRLYFRKQSTLPFQH